MHHSFDNYITRSYEVSLVNWQENMGELECLHVLIKISIHCCQRESVMRFLVSIFCPTPSKKCGANRVGDRLHLNRYQNWGCTFFGTLFSL